MPTSTLDIVLPCYNPPEDWAGRIVDCVSRIKAELPQVIINVILVNDGFFEKEPSEELAVLEKKLPGGFQFLTYQKNMGKGFALRHGVATSQADFCIFTDIDFPYSEASLVKVFNALFAKKQDISFAIKGADYYENVPGVRVKVSRFLRWLVRTFLRMPVSDTQCGLKGFNQNGKAIFMKTTINRFLFDLEFLYLGYRKKQLKLQPIKAELKPDVTFSKMNWWVFIREAGNFLKVFFRSLFT